MKRIYLYLAFIVLLSAFLRFFQISSNPPSLTWDEVSWGYNAYSLGLDGRDEFGRFLPYKYLESFGDFKPPVYAYLDILPVKIWGLTEFAVRFPSAFFGTLTVLTTYFLTLQIFYKSKYKKSISLFSAFILSISPWHINLSRAAFEANVSQFFLVVGILTFLYGINKKPWYLLASSISFSITMYTFNTARVVVPLLLVLFLVLFFKKLVLIKKQTLISTLVGIALIIPIAGFLLSPQASLRFKEVNIFTDHDLVVRSNQQIENDGGAWWSNIIHNRRVFFGLSFIRHYFDNLDPRFLFISGDGNPKFSSQDVGQLYLWCLPFLIAGYLLLFRKREGYWFVLPIWMIVGIIPAATARETPHALRIETVIPTFQIIIAYGLVSTLNFVRSRKKYFTLFNFVIFIALFFNVSYYLYGYYVHYARDYSGEWQYGYKESIDYVTSVEKDYDEIFITTELGRPYIYYLFYQKRDPNYFRRNAVVHRDSFGFVNVKQIGKYRFEDFNLSKVEKDKVLYVDDIYEIPKNAKVLKNIKLLNGKDILVIYTKQI